MLSSHRTTTRVELRVQIYTFFFDTNAKKDKVLYKNTENQRHKKQKANLRGWQLALIMSIFYGILLLLKPTH